MGQGPGARARALTRYRAARDYIDREVVRLEPRRRDPQGKVAAARAFLAALGDPQRRCPAVQVAGTSGKGSVCAGLAHVLRAAGLRAGLHVSPYLQVFTEKTWLDGRYCSPDALADALEVVRPVAERFRADPDCPASVHGLTALATTYVVNAGADLDLAVVETGCGGRFDLVQGLDRALTVITDLGLDHTQALGETLDEIAWHKAGIMERGVPCLAVRGAGWAVLAREAAAVGAPLGAVEPDAAGEVLAFPGWGEVPLPPARGFRRRNHVVVAHAARELARQGWPIAPEHVARGLAEARFPGRLEVVQEEPRVVLDGAHNPQKLAALRQALGPGELVLVAAATGHRSPDALLAAFGPRVRHLVATQVELYGKEVLPATELARAARQAGLAASAVTPPAGALTRALELAHPGDTVLVTGSLYLVGAARERWFPWEEVLLQGTSWPSL